MAERVVVNNMTGQARLASEVAAERAAAQTQIVPVDQYDPMNPDGRKPDSLLVQTGKRYVEGYTGGLGAAVKLGLARVVGVKSRESYVPKGTGEGRGGTKAVLHRWQTEVAEVIDESKKGLRDPGAQEGLFGRIHTTVDSDQDGDGRLGWIFRVSQNDGSREVSPEERLWAKEFAADVKQRGMVEAGRRLNTKLADAMMDEKRQVAVRAIIKNEYDKLRELQNKAKNGVVFSTTPWDCFVASIIGGAEGFDPAFLLGREVSLVLEGGKVMLRSGQEVDQIAPSVGELMVDARMPDKVEAALAAARGQFGGVRWGKLVRSILKPEGERPLLPGTASLGRSGSAGERKVPFANLPMFIDQLSGVLTAMQMAQKRTTEIEAAIPEVRELPARVVHQRAYSQAVERVSMLPRSKVVSRLGLEMGGATKDGEDSHMVADVTRMGAIPLEVKNMLEKEPERVRNFLKGRFGDDVGDEYFWALKSRTG